MAFLGEYNMKNIIWKSCQIGLSLLIAVSSCLSVYASEFSSGSMEFFTEDAQESFIEAENFNDGDLLFSKETS